MWTMVKQRHNTIVLHNAPDRSYMRGVDWLLTYRNPLSYMQDDRSSAVDKIPHAPKVYSICRPLAEATSQLKLCTGAR